MNSSEPDPIPESEWEGFDSRDTEIIIFDGPGDTTVRPVSPARRKYLEAEREKIARYERERNELEAKEKVDAGTNGTESPSSARSRLLELFKARAFSFGKFTLASGKESSYYVNSKKAIFNGEAVWLLAEVLHDMTQNLNIQAVGGLEIGAIPIASALALRYFASGKAVEGFFVRKQAKAHGSQERVEGVLNRGDRVLIVEDVVTTGDSVLQAIQEVEKVGGNVVAVSCIVDRLEGGDAKLEKYNFQPIFTIRDFGVAPPATV
jgi:orotate phosphoribosyltransferase